MPDLAVVCSGTHACCRCRYINREDVDFDLAESLEPVQEWELIRDTADVVEYQTK